MDGLNRRQTLQGIAAGFAGLSLLSGCLSSENGTNEADPTEATTRSTSQGNQTTVSTQRVEVGEHVPIATGKQLWLEEIRSQPQILLKSETGEKQVAGGGIDTFFLFEFRTESDISFSELVEHLQVAGSQENLQLLEQPVVSNQEFETVGVKVADNSQVQDVRIDWRESGGVRYRWEVSGSKLEDLLAVPRFDDVELKFPLSVEKNSQVSFDVQVSNNGPSGDFIAILEILPGEERRVVEFEVNSDTYAMYTGFVTVAGESAETGTARLDWGAKTIEREFKIG